MNEAIPYILPASVTVGGIAQTVAGMTEITEKGHFQSGAIKCLTGLTATNIGGLMLGAGENAHATLMQGSLIAGGGVLSSTGAINVLQGIKQRNLGAIMKGGAQAALGYALASSFAALDPQIIAVAHQTTLVCLVGARILCIGAGEVANGSYQKGLYHISAGAGGIATAGYCAYYTLSNHMHQDDWERRLLGQGESFGQTFKNWVAWLRQQESLREELTPAHLGSFLEQHGSAIDEMSKTQHSSGNWSQLEYGASKTAYTHPDSPYLIKIAHRAKPLRSLEKSDVVVDYENLLDAARIATAHNLDRIVIPKAYLLDTELGPVMLEQKLNFTDYKNVPDGCAKEEAENQLNRLLAKGDFCDINVRINHNACFLSENEATDPKIGLFDCDCNRQQSAALLSAAIKKEIAQQTQQAQQAAMKSKVFWKRVNDLDALSAVTAFLCRTGCGVQAARYLQGPKAAKWLAIAGICAAIAGLSYGMPVGGLVEGLECGGVAASNTMLATAALYLGFKAVEKLRSLRGC